MLHDVSACQRPTTSFMASYKVTRHKKVTRMIKTMASPKDRLTVYLCVMQKREDQVLP